MEANAKLTQRESEVTELIAWGASQKDVACKLGISRYTVDNILRKIYSKLKIGKINELSAWWFCTTFHIDFELSPIRRSVVAGIFLCLFVFGEAVGLSSNFCRCRNRRTNTEVNIRRIRRID